MSPISHEEARRLINFNADQSLDAKTGYILEIHLNGCLECRKYAGELDELENLLRKMKPGLNLRPAPLHLDQIMHRSKGSAFGFLNHILVTRITAITVAFFSVAIVTWQFLNVGNASPATLYAIIPIPTPSTYFITSTNTGMMLLNCDYVPYQTQVGDTMNSIALQFSVSKETIMDFNGMKEEEIKPSMQLRIPRCRRIPTKTSEVVNSTITITPQFEPITLTPG
jgi:hypothetical protein